MSLSAAELRARVERSRLLSQDALEAAFSSDGSDPPTDRLVKEGLLTPFQAKQLEAGRTDGFFLTDKYKLLDFIGHGGMGKVFLCEHLLLQRLVAVKLLQLTTGDGSEAAARTQERFYREARAVAALDHPNIVRLHDVDRAGRDPFMVMEYVDGNNLHAIVADHGPLDPTRAAHYVAQAARGLRHAHDAGLIHRDIKPANLMLDRAGIVKILDLGLARFQQDPTRNQNITARYDNKVIIGTVDFMSPEQAEDSSAVDGRTDIYSLGCTLYFLLTGRVPFPDRTAPQKMYAHQTKAPAPVSEIAPGVPGGLLEVLDRMMAKDPDERYQTPAEVERALAAWTAEPIAPPAVREMPERSAAFYRLGLSPTSSALSVTPNPSTVDTALSPGGAWEVPGSNAGRSAPAPRPDAADLPSLTLNAHGPQSQRRSRPFALVGAALGVVVLATAAIGIALRDRRGSTDPQPDPTPPAVTPKEKAVPFAGPVLPAGGSTFVGPLMTRWAEVYEQGHAVRVTYQGVGSTRGADAVLDRVYAFGCSDVALSDARLAAVRDKGEVVHIPLAMGAVVATYNLPDLKKPLRFTGPVLAGIYLRRITRWNDPALQASNPGVDLPDMPLRPTGRSEGSGTTFVWTDYLSKVSGEFKQQHGPRTELTPAIADTARGNSGVADLVSKHVGAIGYVELSYARENGLPVGEVRNQAGKYVTPGAAGVSAAAAALAPTFPADLRFTLTDAPGADSYPIAGTAWALLYADQTKRPTGKALVEFLRWATHEGQAYAGELGYAPLPPDLVARIDERLNAVKVTEK
jgi:eukaryotic-like serine/threonine-protein kinase